MLTTGLCPKCEQKVDWLNLEVIEIKEIRADTRIRGRGVSYLCPFCKSILSVGIDPDDLKTEIVDELYQKLHGQKML